ncbi:MAG: protein-disulfide reductase DsbD domain-containing protein [Thermodesulfobacteriota bacterium]
MIRLFLILLLMFAVISFVRTGVSANEQPQPVKARILAGVSAVAPGEPFDVAVLLEVEPHWHVYWKNPGDSGLPTSVEFALPPGFTASGLRWPVPSVFKGSGGLTDYGYEDSLLLSARVTPPRDLKPGSSVDIKAMVSWVSCRDICIPGRAELVLTLPVSKSAGRVNTELFTEWNARLPVNYSGRKPPFDIELETVSKGENEYSVVILLDPEDALAGVGLYPAPGSSFIVDGIAVGSGGGGKTSISFDVKALQPHGASQNQIETLVVYKDKSGSISGYEFPVTLSR